MHLAPSPKGDLKWRDALLVAHRVNSNNISATVRNRCDWKEMNEKEAMDGGGSCGACSYSCRRGFRQREDKTDEERQAGKTRRLSVEFRLLQKTERSTMTSRM